MIKGVETGSAIRTVHEKSKQRELDKGFLAQHYVEVLEQESHSSPLV